MERTKYYNQTRPSETQLNWGETTKTGAIKKRFRSSAQMGISSGFQVTVNSGDNTKIDIARGEGYSGGLYLINQFEGVGSGERISTYNEAPSGVDDIGPAATALALADYTASVKNYVSLVYQEVESYNLAERTYPFTSHASIVTDAFVTSVLTETQWNNLTSDDLNSRILVAIVTARGPGVALSASDIDQFVQPKTIPTTTQPGTLTGIVVNALADTTPLGSGTFRWEASTHKLYWTAPGDVEGVGVTVTDSGVYTLYSYNTVWWIRISLIYGTMIIFADTSDTISIYSLYGRTIPMACAVDQAHRDMLGSGVPTPNNVHGISIDDLSGGGYDHADLFHKNGISNDADRTQLEASISAAPGVDAINVVNLGSYSNSFLIDGHVYTNITGFAPGATGVLSFDGLPPPVTADYLIYLDSVANLGMVRVGATLWTANIRIVDMQNTVAGNGTITWSTVTQTLTWEAPGDGAPGTGAYIGSGGGYVKLYSLNTANWIIVNITGLLGASNSSVVAVDMTVSEHSEDLILKLAVVRWDAVTETLSGLVDLRTFFTADIRNSFLEEHDVAGTHTKVLRNTLRLARASTCIRADAQNTAMYAVASTNYAINGYAYQDYGVKGNAERDYGLYGYAERNYGAYGYAVENYGVYGAAETNYGVYGSALVDYGVYGKAVRSIGVYGSAVKYGMQAVAQDSFGIYATASEVGGWFTASTYAVSASAKETCGVYARAATYGVYADGTDKWGVYGKGGASAVVGEATAGGNYGVIGTAAGVIGVEGRAPATAGRFLAAVGNYGAIMDAAVDYGASANAGQDYGLKAVAVRSYGVMGQAASLGVFGSAGIYAVSGRATNYAFYGDATASQDANVYGAFVIGRNNKAGKVAIGGEFDASADVSAYGVIGSVAASGAGGLPIGVYGLGLVNVGTGTGVLGSAGNVDAAGNSYYGVIGKVGDMDTGVGVGVWGSAMGSNGTGVHGQGEWFGVRAQGSQIGVGVEYAPAGVAFTFAIAVPAAGMATQTAIPVSFGANTYYIMLYS